MSIDLTKYDEVDPKALLIGVAHLHEELDARDAEISRLRAALEKLLDVGLCAGDGVEEARAALSGKEGA